jgi:hypothetical protein
MAALDTFNVPDVVVAITAIPMESSSSHILYAAAAGGASHFQFFTFEQQIVRFRPFAAVNCSQSFTNTANLPGGTMHSAASRIWCLTSMSMN